MRGFSRFDDIPIVRQPTVCPLWPSGQQWLTQDPSLSDKWSEIELWSVESREEGVSSDRLWRGLLRSAPTCIPPSAQPSLPCNCRALIRYDFLVDSRHSFTVFLSTLTFVGLRFSKTSSDLITLRNLDLIDLLAFGGLENENKCDD